MYKNSQSKHLLIITGEFPFSKTETFLETEIEYLSKAFDKVTLVPSKAGGPSRFVPANVTVDISYAAEFKKKFRKLTSICSLYFLQGLVTHRKYLFNRKALRRINSFVSDALITKKWLTKYVAANQESAIIYTYWFNGKTFGAESVSGKYKDLKVVSRAHRYDLYDYWFDPPFWPFRQKALIGLDYLYLISEDGKNYLSTKYHLKENKQGVFRLGVKGNNINTLRSLDDTLRMVSVSGLMPVKRVALLAKYLTTYCKKYPERKIHWTHLGDGFLKAGILEYLEKQAPKNLVYDFKGQTTNAGVFEFYKNNAVDLFVNISESEGIPVSIMEAQACGILVAATNTGGVAEIVNQHSGILLPANPEFEDVEDLLNNIRRYLLEFGTSEITNFWNSNYNADYNYPQFTNHLSNL